MGIVMIKITQSGLNWAELSLVINSNKWQKINHFQQAQKCFEAVQPDPGPNFKWRVPFKIRPTVHNFDVRLGPPGGDKGYKAITGQDPPFIELCWWINKKLLPELTVYRGETYYFKVKSKTYLYMLLEFKCQHHKMF